MSMETSQKGRIDSLQAFRALAFLYFVFPFAMAGLKKIRKRTTATVLVVIIYVVMYIFSFAALRVHNLFDANNNFFLWSTYCFPLYRLGDFLIGCAMGYFLLIVSK